MTRSGYGVLATTNGKVQQGWIIINPGTMSEWFEVWARVPPGATPDKHDVRGMRQVLGGHTRFLSWVVWDTATVRIAPTCSDVEEPLQVAWRIGREPFSAHVWEAR